MSETQLGPLAVFRWDAADEDRRTSLLQRGTQKIFEPALQESIRKIVADVRANGDVAVCKALKQFDGCEITPDRLLISDDEFEQAANVVSAEVLAAAREAIGNIRAFNEYATREREWRTEIRPA